MRYFGCVASRNLKWLVTCDYLSNLFVDWHVSSFAWASMCAMGQIIGAMSFILAVVWHAFCEDHMQFHIHTMFLYIRSCACAVATTSLVTKSRHRIVLRCVFCSILLCCFGVAAFAACETATVITRSISLNDIMNFAHRFSSYIY